MGVLRWSPNQCPVWSPPELPLLHSCPAHPSCLVCQPPGRRNNEGMGRGRGNGVGQNSKSPPLGTNHHLPTCPPISPIKQQSKPGNLSVHQSTTNGKKVEGTPTFSPTCPQKSPAGVMVVGYTGKRERHPGGRVQPITGRRIRIKPKNSCCQTNQTV